MGEKVGILKDKGVVFLAVGTTCFDAPVRAVDTPQVKNELFRKGYTNILIQMGRGSYIPNKLTVGNGSAVLEYFTFSSSIADYLKEASLVISHAAKQDHVITHLKVPAGSGSIFGTLRLGKPLMVVVNET